MKWTGLNELREQYLAFFEGRQHLRIDSFPLVPHNDNSLLLINSGMAPMKKWFLGQEEPPSCRVTTCQKCIRTPDIERVGMTARHGTFFEMLGNFSFQDYFKKEAITWAWQFFTNVLEIPEERLYISVYEQDDEAYEIWTQEIGVSASHMVRLGKEDNFWEHGTGPCGPCSEIYFDRGKAYGCDSPVCGPGCDCDRYMEVWNLVFSQFDSDGQGNYERLARPNIDTGMGLERLACVMQGVDNMFEVDTVRRILSRIEQMTGKQYGSDAATDISIRVIGDHIRSTVFMVSDGILPSNEGRGYVLRRLLRRAARHGRMLGVTRPFLADLCDTVIHENAAAYPELAEHADYIKKTIAAEEERFLRTIDTGLSILNDLLKKVKQQGGEQVLSGEDTFRLHDTFGFPLDLTKEIAAERSIGIDEQGFYAALQKQRDMARKDRMSRDISGWTADLFAELTAPPTSFTGYDSLTEQAQILALSDEDGLTEAVATDDGEKDGVLVVLDLTPFYAEAGGQISDTGVLTTQTGARLRVGLCKKTPKGFYVHTCVLEQGIVRKGDRVCASVDAARRRAIQRNHTAAHLLQKALRDVLGDHVHQAGSYEDEARVRFDFTHMNAMSAQELAAVERLVNDKIFEALDVTISTMSIKQAKELGAMALFGEKYGDEVRVVDIAGWSTELCGGTHVSNTAQLGSFKLVSEGGVAAGIRRVEGVTGYGVLQLLDEKNDLLAKSAAVWRLSNPSELPVRSAAAAAELKAVQKQLDELRRSAAGRQVEELLEKAKEVDGVQVFTIYLQNTAADALRDLCDRTREKTPCSVTAAVAENDGKITLAVAVGAKARERGLQAGRLVKEIAVIGGGNGGGKPDFAMAGMKDATKIQAALQAVEGIVKNALQQ